MCESGVNTDSLADGSACAGTFFDDNKCANAENMRVDGGGGGGGVVGNGERC